MAKNPQYSKFTITSQPDPTNEYAIPDYDKDLRTIVNQAVKSALPPDMYFKATPKEINRTTGEMKVDVYVHREDAGVVSSSLSTEKGRLAFKGGDEKYTVTSNLSLSKEENRALWKEERAKDNQETESTRNTRGALLRILGVLTGIADIARRILSSLLTFSQQTVKDMVTAHNLGMSYEAVRSYRHVETTHGLKEGTISGAVADIQAKFGNITSLDEKALEALAVVMGGKIEEMATMGLGASNPEAVLGAILDSFNEKANAGYNSVGQYVGEQQARRELYSYLLKVSPQIADIFATMQDEQHNINSLYRGQAETFEQWKNLVPTARGGNVPENYGVTVTLGQEWNEFKQVLDQIKESFLMGFAPSVLELLRRLADTRIGMSETEKRQRNEENKQANTTALEQVNKDIADIERMGVSNDAERTYLLALKEYKDELTKANKKKGDIPYAVRAPSELVVMANKIAEEELNEKKTTMGAGYVYTPKLDDVKVDEIKDVLSAYNIFDENEMEKLKQEYQTELNKANEKRDNSIKTDLIKKSNYKWRLSNAQLSWKKATNYGGIGEKAYKKLDSTSKSWLALLAQLSMIYKGDFIPNIDTTSLKTIKESIVAEYKRATGEHYISQLKTGQSQIVDDNFNGYVGKHYDEWRSALEEAYPELKYEDDDFLYWLYEQYPDEFQNHIVGARLDDIREQSKTQNRYKSIYTLRDTEGKLNDWRGNIPKTYKGGGTVYAYNDTSGGETTHKIVLKMESKGKTQEVLLGSFLGGVGYEGELGTVEVNNIDGKIDYSFAQGSSPSEVKKSMSGK